MTSSKKETILSQYCSSFLFPFLFQFVALAILKIHRVAAGWPWSQIHPVASAPRVLALQVSATIPSHFSPFLAPASLTFVCLAVWNLFIYLTSPGMVVYSFNSLRKQRLADLCDFQPGLQSETMSPKPLFFYLFLLGDGHVCHSGNVCGGQRRTRSKRQNLGRQPWWRAPLLSHLNNWDLFFFERVSYNPC